MLNLSARRTAIVASDYKQPYWRFEVRNALNTVRHFWSTKEIDAIAGSIHWDSEQNEYRFAADNRFDPGAKFGTDLDEIRWAGNVQWENEERTIPYEFKIIDFNGVELVRSMSEIGLQGPSGLNFSIPNKDLTYFPDDYRNGEVYIALGIDDGNGEEIIRRFRFKIKNVEPEYQKLLFECEDFVQAYLRGSYPNTDLVKDLFPTNDVNQDDAICIPEPYGTCYVPLRSGYKTALLTETATDVSATQSSNGSRCKFTRAAGWDKTYEVGRLFTISGFSTGADNGTFTLLAKTGNDLEIAIDAGLVTDAGGESVTISQGTRPYLLGPSEHDYTITEVRSPREWGKKSTWTSGSYTFTQHTFTDGDGDSWKGFLPMIADVNNDGTADAPGYWQSGEIMLDMPTKFTRSDTANLTNPADVIYRVLQNMGIPNRLLDDDLFLAAKTIFTGWGLTWNGAFWFKRERKEIIALILSQCNSMLSVGDTIGLNIYSKTSQRTIRRKDVIKQDETSYGSFRYRNLITDDYSDAGYAAYMETGEPQDAFYKVLVGAVSGARTKKSEDILELNFVQNSIYAQNLGTLHYQRKYLSNAEVMCLAKGYSLALNPGDVIEIDDPDYGGRYNVLTDSIRLNKDLSLDFSTMRFSSDLVDWSDLTDYVAIVYGTDDTTELWAPSLGGPLSAQDVGKQSFEVWGLPYLVVGPNTNSAKYTNIQTAINALVESRHNGIFILNGIYTHTSPIYFPDRDIDIVGESMGGVDLRNNAGDELFVLYNLTSNFTFSNFYVNSQNAGNTSDALFKIYGSAAANNTSRVMIEKIKFALKDSGTWAQTTGDRAIYCDTGQGSISLKDLYCEDGSYLAYVRNYEIFRMARCQSEDIKRADVDAEDLNDVEIIGLISKNFNYRCLRLYNNSAKKRCIIQSVNSVGKAITGATFQHGIYVRYFDLINIIANIFEFSHSGSGSQDSYTIGAIIYLCNQFLVNKNIISTNVTDTNFATGLYLAEMGNGNIEGNNLKIDNDNATANHYGIWGSNFDNSVVSGNNVNMVNSNAKDIAYYWEATSTGNRGTGNLAVNFGTAETDLGGNAIEVNGA